MGFRLSSRFGPLRAPLPLFLVAALALCLTACGTGISRQVSSAVASTGRVARIGHGVTLSATKLPADARASVTTGTSLPGKNGVAPLAPTYLLTPSGPLPARTTVTMPLSRPAPPGEQVLVVTEETSAGPWTYVPARLTGDRRAVTFETAHFSRFGIIGVGLSELAHAFRTRFIDVVDSGMSATASPPACGSQSAARADGYSIASTDTDAVYWCFGMSGNQRILKVVNNRQYPLELSHPGLSVVSVSSEKNLSVLSRVYSGGYTILGPQGQATYEVNVPVNMMGGVATQADMFGEDMYALQSGLTTLSSIVQVLGLKDVTGGLKLFTQVVNRPSCAAALLQGPTAVLTTCFSAKALGEVFGDALGVVLSSVVAFTSVAQFFRSEFDAGKDLITGKDKYYVTITHEAGAAAPSASATPSAPAAACTSAAIRPGVQASAAQYSMTLDRIDGYGCSGGFAYVFADVGQGGNVNTITVLLKQSGSTWVPANRGIYCPDHAVPSAIYSEACQTN